MMGNNRKGFTLVELIIAVIIVAILAAVATPMTQRIIMRMRRSEAVAALGTIRAAEKIYAKENNGAFAVQSGTQFVNGTGPLSRYIRPGDLSGVFYSQNCYSVSVSAFYPGGYLIRAVPTQSTAPRRTEVQAAGNTYMYGNGVLVNP